MLHSFAQTANITPAVANNKAITIFQQSIGDQSWLYSGPGYRQLRILKTNPFFEDVITTTTGNVTYYGYIYNNVQLVLDIERELLITKWSDNESLFSLHTDKIADFTVRDHHFIRIVTDKTADTPPVTGFYDELVNGKVQLLARRTKKLHIVKEHKSDDDVYDYHVDYYLKKNGRYQSFGSRSALINALADHESELKKHLKDNRTDNEENDMINLARFYNTLTN